MQVFTDRVDKKYQSWICSRPQNWKVLLVFSSVTLFYSGLSVTDFIICPLLWSADDTEVQHETGLHNFLFIPTCILEQDS